MPKCDSSIEIKFFSCLILEDPPNLRFSTASKGDPLNDQCLTPNPACPCPLGPSDFSFLLYLQKPLIPKESVANMSIHLRFRGVGEESIK